MPLKDSGSFREQSETPNSSRDRTRWMRESDQNSSQAMVEYHGYRSNRDTTTETYPKRPFSAQLDTIQEMLEAPSTSKTAEKRPPDLVAELINKLEQRSTEDPTRSSRLLGGTKADADAYLRQIDNETGSQTGNANKEMNKYNQKRNAYNLEKRQGVYQDSEGRTPSEKAAAEEPIGYALSNEYRKLHKRKAR